MEETLDKKVKSLSRRLKILIAGAGLSILANGCSYTISYGVGLSYPDDCGPYIMFEPRRYTPREPKEIIIVPDNYCWRHNRFGCCR